MNYMNHDIAQKTARIYIIHFSLKDVYRNLLNLQN